MLALKKIEYNYDQTNFDFSFEIEQGRFLAVIGPSGAGKSTLLDLIAGFISPNSGEMFFKNKKISELPPAERPISMIFQENNLFAHLDIETNVSLGLSPSLKLSANDQKQVTAALVRVGLQDLKARLPGELSGGQRQRVALARTLVRNKPILLLDEPFVALGPAMRAEMLSLIKDLHTEQNLTTLLVSHQPDDAKSTATHTAFLNQGRIEILEETNAFFKLKNNERLNAYQGNS